MRLPRLRQAVLVAHDVTGTCALLEETFALREPYRDPGVREFGLENAVYEVGDCFLEVVSPVREDTTAGRFLDKNPGDGGYMAIFQVADAGDARDRLASLGARVVWKADLDDIVGTHVHPKDLRGAIVSIDEARPPASWRWGGPRWTGGAPVDREDGGIEQIVIAVTEPDRVEAAWLTAIGDVSAVRFVAGESEGLLEIVLARARCAGAAVRVGSAVVRAV